MFKSLVGYTKICNCSYSLKFDQTVFKEEEEEEEIYEEIYSTH